jgi:hypothetical protein
LVSFYTNARCQRRCDLLFGKAEQKYTLHSNENADLDTLFKKWPEAKTLYEWAPFVVIVDDNKKLSIYTRAFTETDNPSYSNMKNKPDSLLKESQAYHILCDIGEISNKRYK